MDSFVRMACVRSHMGLMEGVKARSGATLEMVTFVANKWPTRAAGIVKEVIVAPIAVIHWAVVAVVVAIVIHRPIYAGACCQCEQRGSGQSRFHCVFQDELPDSNS